MKRRDLLRHLFDRGCVFVREGANHTTISSVDGQRFSTIPRHNEVNEFLAKKICKDLGIDIP